jgi:hypothetical protein
MQQFTNMTCKELYAPTFLHLKPSDVLLSLARHSPSIKPILLLLSCANGSFAPQIIEVPLAVWRVYKAFGSLKSSFQRV